MFFMFQGIRISLRCILLYQLFVDVDKWGEYFHPINGENSDRSVQVQTLGARTTLMRVEILKVFCHTRPGGKTYPDQEDH